MTQSYEIFNLMFNLSSLEHKEQVVRQFVDCINEIFSESVIRYHIAHPESQLVKTYPIQKGESLFGYISISTVVKFSDQDDILMRNAVQMLAMILENLRLSRNLKHERDVFKIVANQRLVELTKTINDLEEARVDEQNLIRELSAEIEKRVHIEDTLRDNEEKYRRIAEHITDVVWTADMNFNTTYLSPSIYNLTGRTVEQHIGLPLEQKFSADSLLLINKALQEELINEQNPENDRNRSRILEVQYYKADGELIWVAMNISFIRDSRGNIIGFHGVTRDIHNQKLAQIALKNSERKYRLIFENSPLGVFQFDKTGKIIECNDPFVQIIGSSKKQIVGLDMTQLPDKRILEGLEKVLKGKRSSYTGIYTSVTGKKTTPVRLLLSPVLNSAGLPDGGIGMVEDRTTIIEKEEFKKQADLANESIKFKQNFLANMSHEIRTPLTGIMGMLEILGQTPLTQLQQDYLNSARNSSENLKEIINQILDFSKIEAGKVTMDIRPMRFSKLIECAEKYFKDICDKEIEFDVQVDENIPAFMRADKCRLNQIINNLISNAVKYTLRGKIKLHASLISQNDNSLNIRLEISDTGIGMTPIMQKKLFTPFTRIEEDDTRGYEGIGLGLSICKELVKLHGGEIGISSKFQRGSTFWFTFVAMACKDHDVAHTRQISNRLRILFAEDKLINQKVVNLMLSSMGHEVTLANDGYQALKQYSPGKFDLILMDIQMPIMDGITATRQLKKHYEKLPPIVGLSANAFEGDKEKYMALGMDDYLTKPVKKDDFSDLLSRLF